MPRESIENGWRLPADVNLPRLVHLLNKEGEKVRLELVKEAVTIIGMVPITLRQDGTEDSVWRKWRAYVKEASDDTVSAAMIQEKDGTVLTQSLALLHAIQHSVERNPSVNVHPAMDLSMTVKFYYNAVDTDYIYVRTLTRHQELLQFFEDVTGAEEYNWSPEEDGLNGIHGLGIDEWGRRGQHWSWVTKGREGAPEVPVLTWKMAEVPYRDPVLKRLSHRFDSASVAAFVEESYKRFGTDQDEAERLIKNLREGLDQPAVNVPGPSIH